MMFPGDPTAPAGSLRNPSARPSACANVDPCRFRQEYVDPVAGHRRLIRSRSRPITHRHLIQRKCGRGRAARGWTHLEVEVDPRAVGLAEDVTGASAILAHLGRLGQGEIGAYRDHGWSRRGGPVEPVVHPLPESALAGHEVERPVAIEEDGGPTRTAGGIGEVIELDYSWLDPKNQTPQIGTAVTRTRKHPPIPAPDKSDRILVRGSNRVPARFDRGSRRPPAAPSPRSVAQDPRSGEGRAPAAPLRTGSPSAGLRQGATADLGRCARD